VDKLKELGVKTSVVSNADPRIRAKLDVPRSMAWLTCSIDDEIAGHLRPFDSSANPFLGR
jgi:hypothetical protein